MEDWLLDIWNQLPEGPTFVAAACLIAYLEGLVGIGLIVPGSTLVVVSGFLAFQGKADFIVLAAWTAVGAFLGDLTSYWLGARFGPYLWDRRFIVRRRELVRKAEIVFIENGAKSIFFGRFLGPIRGLVPFVAGASKMGFRSFLAYALLSALLWGLSYPGLGYLGGTSWQHAQTWVGRFGILIILLLIVSIMVGWFRRTVLGPAKPGTKDAERGTRTSKTKHD